MVLRLKRSLDVVTEILTAIVTAGNRICISNTQDGAAFSFSQDSFVDESRSFGFREGN